MRYVILIAMLLASCSTERKPPNNAALDAKNDDVTISSATNNKSCTDQQREALKKAGLNEASSLNSLLDVLLTKDSAIPLCS